MAGINIGSDEARVESPDQVGKGCTAAPHIQAGMGMIAQFDIVTLSQLLPTFQRLMDTIHTVILK